MFWLYFTDHAACFLCGSVPVCVCLQGYSVFPMLISEQGPSLELISFLYSLEGAAQARRAGVKNMVPLCVFLWSENGHFYGNGDRPAMIFGSPIQAVVCHAAMRMPLSHRPGTLHGLDHALPGHADVSEIFFNGLPFAPERSNHRLLTWEDPLGASAWPNPSCPISHHLT